MRYGSVCSGVEAASLAWEPLGWKPAFFAEVNGYCSHVLHHRFGASRPLRPIDPASIEPKFKTNKSGKKVKTKAYAEALSNYRDIQSLPETGKIINFGDFTTITKEDINGNIDLLVGGTPCQGFSNAGARKGMGDERSVLAKNFIRLAFELECHWVVWENVPGVFSCNKGMDFAAFLGELSKRNDLCIPKKGWKNSGIVEPGNGGFGLAWRVLDAQYVRTCGKPYAVPQRRRRVFIVGYIGDWRRAAAVLFDSQSVYGSTAPVRQAGTGVARNLTASAGGCSGKEQQYTFIGNDGKPLNALSNIGFEVGPAGCRQAEVSATLDTKCKDGPIRNQTGMLCMSTGQGSAEIGIGIGTTLNCNHEAPIVCVHESGPGFWNDDKISGTVKVNMAEPTTVICYDNHAQDSRMKECGDVCPQLNAKSGTSGGNLPLIQSIHQNASGEVRLGDAAYTINTNGNASGRNAPLVLAQETAHTLRGEGFDGSEDGTGRGTPIVAFMAGAGSKAGSTGACEDFSPTLRASDCGSNRSPAIAETLTANWHKSNGAKAGNNSGVMNPVILNSTVRRLTPLECERLMGFPDWHTLIPWKVPKKLSFQRFERKADLMEQYKYFRRYGFEHETAMIYALCPDGKRYMGCGNSMCTNAMEYIGERIEIIEAIISRLNKA